MNLTQKYFPRKRPPTSANGSMESARTCGDCTACCDGWLEGDIYGAKMGNGTPCRFIRPEGCSIYGSRPDLCKTYMCGWIFPDSPFPENWRPDKIGIIINAHEWEKKTVWFLIPAGNKPSEQVLEWMRAHTKATGEPHVIRTERSDLCYGKPAFQRYMLEFERAIKDETGKLG
jgi:hypothetical protein